jgi:hypothetical protein
MRSRLLGVLLLRCYQSPSGARQHLLIEYNVFIRNRRTEREMRPRKTRTRSSNSRGASLPEALAAMALLLPLILLSLMMVIEVSAYFTLKQGLAFVARRAAYELATAYSEGEHTSNKAYTGMNSGYPREGSGNTANANYNRILNAIGEPGVINTNSARQFTVSWTNSTQNPQFVSVYVQYENGSGLPAFPWNPIGSLGVNFQLPPGLLGSSCIWPVPE